MVSIRSMSASVKASTSSGLRLVTMLPSVTAGSSTTFAPAFRRSVRIEGQLVGMAHTAGEDERIEIVGVRLVDNQVRTDRLAGIIVDGGLDRIALQRSE